MAQGKLHTPTKDTQEQVKRLSALGCPHEDIATRLKISADTLVKYYKDELDEGQDRDPRTVLTSRRQERRDQCRNTAGQWTKRENIENVGRSSRRHCK